MASFAKIDEQKIVLQVIAISNAVCGEPELTFPDTEALGQQFIADVLNLGGFWLQTSYNNNIRKQYAGIGYTYDEDADVFISPQPFPSWLLDENYDWQAPIDYPADGKDYSWDEANQVWVELPAS